MKALIINAGVGKRMGDLTKDKPKCLIEIANKQTILGRQLEMLANNNVNNIIMTTGYFEDKIRNYVTENFPNANINYIYNPKYTSTNCIYSVFLTREVIDDDILFITGDLVFDEKVIKKLLNTNYPNLVIVNNNVKPPKKDFKSRIEGDIVKEIGINVFGKNCFFSLPIYKISKDSFLLWTKEIEKLVKKGEIQAYAETVFNNISSQINLKPIYLNNEFCTEIDTTEELEIVRKYLKGN